MWDCPNAKAAFYEAKRDTQTIINDRINWCMAEIERLRSLEILDWWNLEQYAAEMQYLQTTVSDYAYHRAGTWLIPCGRDMYLFEAKTIKK